MCRDKSKHSFQFIHAISQRKEDVNKPVPRKETTLFVFVKLLNINWLRMEKLVKKVGPYNFPIFLHLFIDVDIF